MINLKAGLDANIVNMEDYDDDPHCIAGEFSLVTFLTGLDFNCGPALLSVGADLLSSVAK